jgi:ATPase subunit of ABC transporter with duplicated ATPase domains
LYFSIFTKDIAMPLTSFELIKFYSVSKSYGPKQVLTDVSFTISQGERFALIGENGSGKTTLARLMMGLESPDSGEVTISPQSQIGYLPQETMNTFHEHLSTQEFLLESQGGLKSLSQRMSELENLMTQPLDATELERFTAEWDALYHAFVARGGYDTHERTQDCLKALNLQHLSPNRPLAQLSEGEKRRVHLASLLLKTPNLLILDEPTNHLDRQALEWLENFLSHFRGAVLLISHDRHFLNQVATGMIELSPHTHQFAFYPGNYDDYLSAKQKELSRHLEAFEKQREEISELKSFLKEQTFSSRKIGSSKDSNKIAYDRRGERHMNGKRKAISQAKQQVESLEAERLVHPIPKDYKGIIFQPKKSLEGAYGVILESINIEIDGTLLMEQFSASAYPGERVILSGPNGSGKSTLLRLLATRQLPKKGKIQFASTANLGFLPQAAIIEGEHFTLLEYLQKKFSLPEHELRSQLHQIALIEDCFINQSIVTLSLGQKRRLQLLTLMLEQPNILLLDEPTNHLAPHLIDQLEEALLSFSVIAIVATHDRRFAGRVGTAQWEWNFY